MSLALGSLEKFRAWREFYSNICHPLNLILELLVTQKEALTGLEKTSQGKNMIIFRLTKKTVMNPLVSSKVRVLAIEMFFMHRKNQSLLNYKY